MFGSSILDVAIGVIFVFLLVSLIVTAVTELIAGWLKWRATNLWKGIQNLLGNEALARQLYQHPLIQAVSPMRRNSGTQASAKRWAWLKAAWNLISSLLWPKARGPSYIQPRTYAIALVELTQPQDLARVLAGTKTRLQAALNALPPNATRQQVQAALEHAKGIVLGGANVPPLIKKGLELLIKEVSANVTADEAKRAVEDFIAGRDGITHLTATVLTLFEEAGQNLEKLKVNIETWFNDAMDRVSGWYKRKTQLVHIVLAIGCAVTLNVDSVLIAKTLLNNPALRQSIVAQAEKFAEQPPVAITVPQPAPAQPGVSQPPPTAPPASPGLAINPSTVTEEKYRVLKAELDQLGLPIGWTSPGNAGKDNSDFREWVGWPKWSWKKEQYTSWIDKWWVTFRFHLLGWLLTAVAASLGAPFWFDMLNKIISIRSAGRSPEEKEKEKKPPK